MPIGSGTCQLVLGAEGVRLLLKLVEIAQDGEILNANGTIEYKFKDHFRASSITLVHAQPNASWYKPGAMWEYVTRLICARPNVRGR